jgi:hypothetical protein
MTRTLYQSLLWLHPPRFRERYAEEMTWIFDETAPPKERAFLFYDGLVSLARQWVVRSGLWKVALAALLAAVQAVFFLHPYD